jgi:hypothetical protein
MFQRPQVRQKCTCMTNLMFPGALSACTSGRHQHIAAAAAVHCLGATAHLALQAASPATAAAEPDPLFKQKVYFSCDTATVRGPPTAVVTVVTCSSGWACLQLQLWQHVDKCSCAAGLSGSIWHLAVPKRSPGPEAAPCN